MVLVGQGGQAKLPRWASCLNCRLGGQRGQGGPETAERSKLFVTIVLRAIREVRLNCRNEHSARCGQGGQSVHMCSMGSGGRRVQSDPETFDRSTLGVVRVARGFTCAPCGQVVSVCRATQDFLTGLHRLNCLNCLGDHNAQCRKGGKTEPLCSERSGKSD